MAQEPEVIRRDIEATRDHMGDTVDALAHRANVPGRAKDRVTGAAQNVKEKIAGAGTTVADGTPDAGQVKDGAKRAVGVAQENPVGLAIGAAAFGFLAGMLIPSTRIEDEKLGPLSDQVSELAAQTGQQALDAGKQVAQEVAGTAKEQGAELAQQVTETATETAQEQGEQLKQNIQDSASQVDAKPQGASV